MQTYSRGAFLLFKLSKFTSLVLLDDYGHIGFSETRKLVDEWVNKNNNRVFFNSLSHWTRYDNLEIKLNFKTKFY